MADAPEIKAAEPVESRLFIPTGFPEEVYKNIRRGLKPEPQRGVVFENEKQRNATFIQKGLSKPGKISYDTLRRAANSVHVARICINVLKSKITKTPWVIKSRDPLKKVDESKKKKVEDLFNYPNQNSETFRTLLDKMLEDLLVLDAVSVEKTRYPGGELAELHFVDSATIRPVYDELGNQDVEIPLSTKREGEVDLPVSFLQILNNSQYGGPESGDVIAAWPKRDMIHFHMHPQGAMEGFGYGLSPLEGVLSVVANLLNADNYNSTYFEEGSFPPIILHLAGNIAQRDAEAFREYMYQEMTGNFHRPAFMAGGEKMEVLDLKSDSNRDMQFMEYQIWLAKLMCAAYGLSPQDIGLTDDVNRSTSETMEDLSNQKGYGSILDLLKEILNQQIIWKDFGFEDIEFDWVAQDSTEPDKAAIIYDTELKNGTSTINEIREKQGKTPYGKWADEPMILTSEGYKPVMAMEEDAGGEGEEGGDDGKMGGEKPFKAGDKGDEEGTELTKSRSKTLYISRPVKNAKEIIDWAKAQGFDTTLTAKDMHVTLAHSSVPVNWDDIELMDKPLIIQTSGRTVMPLGPNGAVVLCFTSEKLQRRWRDLCAAGASWDYPDFNPHITISFSGGNVDLSNIKPYLGEIILGPEKREQLSSDWATSITEKSLAKANLTQGGYRTWADDRGYSQPFIYMDIKGGWGRVIKPPVAVNLESQNLEIALTHDLAAQGLNVKPVNKMTYVEVIESLRAMPDVLMEFERYCGMTPDYDSEKWRKRFGGSRKFPYYLVSDFIDGYSLNDPLLLADMKRDPNSYRKAIQDLADLWAMEKKLVLGDRRADQYIIGHDKRAYGIDYQFKGDKDRWERTKNAVRETLAAVPQLATEFETRLDGTLKSLVKKASRMLK